MALWGSLIDASTTSVGAGSPLGGLDVPPHDSPFLDAYLSTGALETQDVDALRALARDGYVVLDLGIEDFDTLAADVVAETEPLHARDGNRVAEAWTVSPAVTRLAAHPRVVERLAALYGRRPIPFQTLNFERGTEQAAHSDTIHFHCVPRHFMCGVWVALEDIHPDAGPLFVHPGSHRLPTFEMGDLGLPARVDAYAGYEERVARALEAGGHEAKPLCIRRGQAIVWVANVFHGGAAVADPGRTRRSQVTHYYFGEGFHYLPLVSDVAAGRICYREVIDIGTRRFVEPTHRGRPVHLGRQRDVQRYPRPLPDDIDVARRLRDVPARVRHGVSKVLERFGVGRERGR